MFENSDNIYSDEIFKDCYIENNGVLKFHKLKSNDIQENEDDQKNLATEFDKNLYLDKINKSGKLNIINSGGVFSSDNEEEQEKKIQKITLPEEFDIKLNESFYYDDLNLKFFKNHNIPLRDVNNALYKIKNYKNVFLNMDDINKEAFALINEPHTQESLLKKDDLLLQFPIISKEDEEELNLEDRDLLFLLNAVKSSSEKSQDENYLAQTGKLALNLQKIFLSINDFDTEKHKGMIKSEFMAENDFTKRQKIKDSSYLMQNANSDSQKDLYNTNKRIILSNLKKLLARDEFDTFYY